MAIHVRWDPPEGSVIPTVEELGPPLHGAKRAVERRYPGAYYSERLPGLTHLGILAIIHVWKDRESSDRGACEVPGS